VPPVEIISTPAAASDRAKGTSPVLSETESSARRICSITGRYLPLEAPVKSIGKNSVAEAEQNRRTGWRTHLKLAFVCGICVTSAPIMTNCLVNLISPIRPVTPTGIRAGRGELPFAEPE